MNKQLTTGFQCYAPVDVCSLCGVLHQQAQNFEPEVPRMAQRRMFSLKVVDTDDFLDMPMSSQHLYMSLALRADDDGFVGNPKKICRLANCTDDDFKVLIAKKYIIPFESGICVIRHWRIHNYIQNDRYTPTEYQEELKSLKVADNKYFPSNVSKMDTQVRLESGKVSKEENSKPKVSDIPFSLKEEIQKLKKSPQRHIQLIGEYLEEIGFVAETKKAFDISLRRHLKDAVSLSAFEDSQIGKASDYANKEYKKIGWNLGTLVKIISSNLYAK